MYEGFSACFNIVFRTACRWESRCGQYIIICVYMCVYIDNDDADADDDDDDDDYDDDDDDDGDMYLYICYIVGTITYLSTLIDKTVTNAAN